MIRRQTRARELTVAALFRRALAPVTAHTKKSRRGDAAAALEWQCEEVSVLGRPGSDLLFQALRLSTIGAGEFDGRVRDGIGYRLPANTTRSAKDGMKQARAEASASRSERPGLDPGTSSRKLWSFAFDERECALKMSAIKFERAISTGKLNALPRLHTRPINVVVYYGS